jgi:Chemotaxis phosphatase CheX
MSMSSKLTLDHWRTAVQGAATEIATRALSFSGAIVRDPVALERSAAMIGAHIPLVGGGQAFEMALVSTAEGCEALARAILCMPSGPAPRDAEIADAIREIVNMLAGSVKRRLAGHGAHLTLGLPIFIRGYLQPSDGLSVIALPIHFGPVDTIALIAAARE